MEQNTHHTDTGTNTNTTAGTSTGTRPRELRRTHQGRMIAGVCSGLSEYLGVDANVIRLALAALTFFTVGTAAAVYVAGWLLIPEEGQSSSIAQDLIAKQRDKF